MGRNCLNIRKGVGQLNFKIKTTSKEYKKQELNINLKNENYGLTFWDMTLNTKLNAFKSFKLEDSLPCAFILKDINLNKMSYLGVINNKRFKNSMILSEKIAKNVSKYRETLIIDEIVDPVVKSMFNVQKELRLSMLKNYKYIVSKVLSLRSVVNSKMRGYNFYSLYKCLKIDSVKKDIQFLHDSKKLKGIRSKMYYDATVAKKYFRALRRRRSYPVFEFTKRTTMFGHMYKTKRETIATAFIGDQYERHPVSQTLYIKKYLNTTINGERFEQWETTTKKIMSFTNFYKTVWRYFKLKLERFFYKKMGVRMHVWFMNIWDIFMTGVDSYWRWFKFEDQKIFAMTRKGQKYLIEGREEAKFYLRSMALTLTFGGGIKLFINKVTTLLRQYRNNWAFITYTMESLRLCGNFFWFRFFLNYKVTLQGKIGGILRAAKKTFKKGDVTVEDRSSTVAHYRTFPNSKFGVYCLGFWLQYRVPNLIGTFDELEYIDTMRVLLSMYTIPWLSTRLTEIIEAILREREIKKQIKFNQYNRRQRARGILASEFKLYNKKSKFKKLKVK